MEWRGVVWSGAVAVHSNMALPPYFPIVVLAVLLVVQIAQKLLRSWLRKPFPMPRLAASDFVQNPHPDAGQRVQLLECFAPWCGPCQRMAPHMNELQERYGADVYIAALSSEPEAQVRKFVQDYGCQYNVAASQECTHLLRECGSSAFPHACIFVEKICVWDGHPMFAEKQLRKYVQLVKSGELDAKKEE